MSKKFPKEEDNCEIQDENSKSEEKIDTINIEKLQSFGIAMIEIKKLQEIGLYSVEALIRAPRKELTSIKGFSEIKVDKILKEAIKLVHFGFQAASSMLKQQVELIRITTGSKKLDDMLEGGIESGSITEIFGEYRCGKTQLSHTLAVTCQLPLNMGGAEGKCLYIDTEGAFRPQRLVQIASRFGLSSDVTLDNVAYARAYNTEQQTNLLVVAAGLMSTSRFALIIVDSATALYRSEFNGRGELYVRQSHMGRFLRGLQKIADEKKVAVIVTNQVMDSNLDSRPNIGPSIKPCGGHIMAHSVFTRLQMSKGKKHIRKVKIIASPSLAEGVVEINIGAEGIQDLKEES